MKQVGSINLNAIILNSVQNSIFFSMIYHWSQVSNKNETETERRVEFSNHYQTLNFHDTCNGIILHSILIGIK